MTNGLDQAQTASDGDGFFTVWTDAREQPRNTPEWPDGPMTMLYGARSTASGQLLDPIGIRLVLGRLPSVSFGLDSYLVLSGGNTIEVGRDGSIRNRSSIPAIAEDSSYPVGSQETFLIRVEDGYLGLFPGQTTLATLLDFSGRPTSGAFPILAGFAVAAASNGSSVLVIYTRDSKTYAGTFDQSGQPIRLDQILPAVATYSVSLAHDGTSYLVVWVEQTTTPSLSSVKALKLDAEGSPTGEPFVLDTLYLRGQPLVTASGAGYLVAAPTRLTDSKRGAHLIQVSSNSGITGRSEFTGEDNRSLDSLALHSIATNGRGAVLVYQVERQLRGQLLSPSGVPADEPFLLAQAAVQQDGGFGVGAERVALTSWQEWDGLFSSSRHVSRVDLTGDARPAQSITFGTSIVAGNDNFLYSFLQEGLRTVIVGLDGVPLPGTETGLATGQVITDRALAWDGTHYVMTWVSRVDLGRGVSGRRLEGALLSPDGSLYGQLSSVPIGGHFYAEQDPPRASCNRSGCLILWRELQFETPCPEPVCARRKILGIRIDPTGRILDPSPILVANYENSSAFEGLEVASTESGFLIAWRQYWNGDEMHVSGLDNAGKFIAVGTGILDRFGSNPSVAAAGNQYLIVWQKGYQDSDIVGVRVDHLWRILDSTPVKLAGSPVNERSPKVARLGSGFLLVYERPTPDSEFGGVYRVFTRRIFSETHRRAVTR